MSWKPGCLAEPLAHMARGSNRGIRPCRIGDGHAIWRGFDPRAQPMGTASGLTDYAMRGPLVIARALAVYGIAVAVGALVSRQLPALLLAGALTLGLFGGLNLATTQIARRDAVPMAAEAEAGGPCVDLRQRAME